MRNSSDDGNERERSMVNVENDSAQHGSSKEKRMI
jgi:hypothetical protein